MVVDTCNWLVGVGLTFDMLGLTSEMLAMTSDLCCIMLGVTLEMLGNGKLGVIRTEDITEAGVMLGSVTFDPIDVTSDMLGAMLIMPLSKNVALVLRNKVMLGEGCSIVGDKVIRVLTNVPWGVSTVVTWVLPTI